MWMALFFAFYIIIGIADRNRTNDIAAGTLRRAEIGFLLQNFCKTICTGYRTVFSKCEPQRLQELVSFFWPALVELSSRSVGASSPSSSSHSPNCIVVDIAPFVSMVFHCSLSHAKPAVPVLPRFVLPRSLVLKTMRTYIGSSP